MRTEPLRSVLLESLLIVAGTVGLLYCLMLGFRMYRAQNAADGIVQRFGAVAGKDPLAAEPASSPTASGNNFGANDRPQVVGRVEIPALGLKTPLMSGDDSMSLSEGAGHIPGTAVPGGLGTVGIAGHRDTHFRLLSKVAPGMDVLLVSRAGTFHYRVISSEIVLPEQVSVLATGQVPGLALVTCYPFQLIGHAPNRFIVHAELVSAAPDSQ